MDQKIIMEMSNRYLAGEDTYALAKRFGCSAPHVAKLLRLEGVSMRAPGNKNGLYAADRDAQIIKLYNDGVKTKAIAKQLGTSTATIAKLKKEYGLEHRVKPLSLTEGQQQDIIVAYQEGLNYEELAEKYDVAPVTIGDVLNRHGIKARRGWSKYRTVKWTDRIGRNFIFKSTWELKFAQKLDAELKDWKYEAVSYRFMQTRSYTPDFTVYTDGEIEKIYELHSWFDILTMNRIRAFVKHHHDLPYELIGPGEMAQMGLVEKKYLKHKHGKNITEVRNELLSRTAGSIVDVAA